MFLKDVLIGLSDGSKGNICVYIINLIIIMANYHIHRCKIMGKKPCYIALNGELRQYILSKYLKQKAIITVTICTNLNIFIVEVGIDTFFLI